MNELRPVRRPVAIDLFAGAGGLSLGFESAGFDVLSAVEYDPVHAATHLFNFPRADVVCADIASLRGEDLIRSARKGWSAHYPEKDWDGVVDAVIGGPSCQGFSAMGRQDASDERNRFILEFVRLVAEVRPRAFCMENVPGLLDARFDEIRSRALRALSAAGYEFVGHEDVLHAEDFGVPQRRRRVMILGVLRGEGSPQPPKPTGARVFTVADALEGLPELKRRAPVTTTDSLRLSTRALRNYLDARGDFIEFADVKGRAIDGLGHPRDFQPQKLHGYRSTLHSASSVARFRATAQGAKEPISRAYRLAWDQPALTLRAGTGRERGSFSAARPLHPVEPRVVTAREAARLHSFPDWFRFHTTNWHAHRQIGNSVPPLLARAAAIALLAALESHPQASALGRACDSDERLLSFSPTEAARFFEVAEDQVPKRRRTAMAPLQGSAA
ncbi:cytosine-specific methyltransferase [Agromyces luteolus]|uniref:DNA cytosine methyltransferase n=1 Tax=Agromyces luteolus TaxID=88373 RepID=UPI001413321C|nr:DNA cytosine methyltransferase [Agromyces luteolus]GLK27968.1 cytosine-specific methyltransferase [Agromyces luteolus]